MFRLPEGSPKVKSEYPWRFGPTVDPDPDNIKTPGPLGAIIGDICGSVYEFKNVKTNNPEELDLFDPRCRYTDDTVMTIATMDALIARMHCLPITTPAFNEATRFSVLYRRWGNKYPRAGYGPMFCTWLAEPSTGPYNSYGNGSAMRVSPIGWLDGDERHITDLARLSAGVTHNHPEGLKGAAAVACAIHMARAGSDKVAIKARLENSFSYNLGRKLDDIRPTYQFDCTCQGSVPEAITAFLESNDFTHAIQLAISLGGDSDTIACITGSVAEAFYKKIPEDLAKFALSKLTEEQKEILRIFSKYQYV